MSFLCNSQQVSRHRIVDFALSSFKREKTGSVVRERLLLAAINSVKTITNVWVNRVPCKGKETLRELHAVGTIVI